VGWVCIRRAVGGGCRYFVGTVTWEELPWDGNGQGSAAAGNRRARQASLRQAWIPAYLR